MGVIDRIQLAMLDVDGTLWHDGWLPGALDLVDECCQRGWTLALCSGRPANSLMGVAQQLSGVSYIASGNGTAVWRHDDGDWTLVADRALSTQAVAELFALTETHPVRIWGFTVDEWLATADDEATRRIADFLDIEPVIDPLLGRDDLTKIEFTSATATSVYGDGDPLQVPRDLLDRHGLAAVSSVPGSMDVVLRAAAETKGGDLIAEDLGIGWDHIFAAGNGHNDLGMLRNAAISAALPHLTREEAQQVGAWWCARPDEVVARLRALD